MICFFFCFQSFSFVFWQFWLNVGHSILKSIKALSDCFYLRELKFLLAGKSTAAFNVKCCLKLCWGHFAFFLYFWSYPFSLSTDSLECLLGPSTSASCESQCLSQHPETVGLLLSPLASLPGLPLGSSDVRMYGFFPHECLKGNSTQKFSLMSLQFRPFWSPGPFCPNCLGSPKFQHFFFFFLPSLAKLPQAPSPHFLLAFMSILTLCSGIGTCLKGKCRGECWPNLRVLPFSPDSPKFWLLWLLWYFTIVSLRILMVVFIVFVGWWFICFEVFLCLHGANRGFAFFCLFWCFSWWSLAAFWKSGWSDSQQRLLLGCRHPGSWWEPGS